jgi:hypothetical protein
MPDRYLPFRRIGLQVKGMEADRDDRFDADHAVVPPQRVLTNREKLQLVIVAVAIQNCVRVRLSLILVAHLYRLQCSMLLKLAQRLVRKRRTMFLTLIASTLWPPVPKSSEWWSILMPQFDEGRFRRYMRVGSSTLDWLVTQLYSETEV